MADRDPITEAQRLAETLRETIAVLDARIEERARAIAAELRPATAPSAMEVALEKVSKAGEAMRQHMLDRTPEGEGRDFLASIPPIKWKCSAALLLLDICEEERRRFEKGEGDGRTSG